MVSLLVCAKSRGTRPKPRWEVADIFRLHGEAYRLRHPLPGSHRKVMRAIERCRTAALGGHLERCDHCAFERPAYNSCRNRHCPKCQALTKVRWLKKRKAELLPVPYFHNVFTLPHELNPLMLANKKALIDLLFKAVAETLLSFGADPQHGLGGKVGFTAVLHTWNQKLLDHFHLHCLIPAGALSFDGSRWTSAREGFLFPVRALSRAFRGKFIEGLRGLYAGGELIFPGRLACLETQEAFSRLLGELWDKEWVVYSQPPFSGPEKALDYLGRYTHRVAISNNRIVNLQDGQVTFRYRDGDRVRAMTLSAENFIRRFLLHVLPNSLVRMRHFGFLSNRSKAKNLPRCRELLGLSPELPKVAEQTIEELFREVVGVDPSSCPSCKIGCFKRVAELPKIPPCDSS
jgi:hypothetical protein